MSTRTIERGMMYRWAAVETPDDRPTRLIDRVLAARGLAGSDAESFLDPSLRALHDPSQIPDLDRAAGRILAAVREREQIVIYGDYDVDGITATAILFHTLRAVSPDVDLRWYVPHRMDEGYGLNTQALAHLAEQGARVVVTVDCGVTATTEAIAARDLGLDLIVTDHHNPPASVDDLPDAYAVVHPARPDSSYPFTDLCGAGVAYKLAWRFCTLACGSERVSASMRAMLVELLSFAALGTIADVVPLVGENRVLAAHGLRRIKQTPFAGLRALVEASGLAGESIDADRVGFSLGPRLNACGRLGHAGDAVRLFTNATGEDAQRIARMLTTVNEERRTLEKTIFEHAQRMAIERGMTDDSTRAIVLAHEDWHPGVLGIVCSRLVERFNRPTILMQRAHGVCTGSGRSVDQIDLHATLASCEDHLDRFGGHRMAAGLRLDERKLDGFVSAFVARVNSQTSIEDLTPTRRYDCTCALKELDEQAVAELGRLAPFGRANPSVCVRVDDLRVLGKPEMLGREGKHLALRFAQGSRVVRCVAWGWGERYEDFADGDTGSALLRPKLSTWNARTAVEPELVDWCRA